MASMASVCVYCGSSSRVRQEYKDAAAQLGRTMADAGVRLIYGGGQVGLMGILADSVLAHGGEVVGIIPDFLFEKEIGKADATRLVRVASMHERKEAMADLSDGFAILPGGFGTLDETFEILTWRQLGLHDKPVVIANIAGYWTGMLSVLDHLIDEGFALPDNRGLYDVVGTVEEILPALRRKHLTVAPIESKWM